MFIFAIISVLNLVLGFAAAVMLGYGPRPWWAIFANPATAGTVRIEKLDDEVLEPVEPTDESDDEQEESELDEDHDEEAEREAASELNRLQEINAEKLANRLESERRAVASAQKKQVSKEHAAALQPTELQGEAEEAPEIDSAGIIDEADLASLAGGDTPEAVAEDEIESLLSAAANVSPAGDVDESLDEIESLLKAAGQLEVESSPEVEAVAPAAEQAEAEPAEAEQAEVTPAAETSSTLAEADEAEPGDRALSAAEIEAMFK